jgi:hypothetical protein
MVNFVVVSWSWLIGMLNIGCKELSFLLKSSGGTILTNFIADRA